MKIYFLPGVGADASLAPYHELPGHDVAWIRWPADPGRTWEEFTAALLAENRIEAGSVLIGISFGGMVAQAIASRVRAAAVILISSCRTSRAINPLLRILRPCVPWIPEVFFNMSLMPRVLAGRLFGITGKPHLDLLYAMGDRLPPDRFKRINALALGFAGAPGLGIPVFSIHGVKDRIILAGREPRDQILRGGGHLISMTHTDEVNRAILGWLGGLE